MPTENFSPVRRSQIAKIVDPSQQAKPLIPKFSGNGEKIGSNDAEVVLVDQNIQLESSVKITRIQIILPNGSRKVISISARAKISELYLNIRKE